MKVKICGITNKEDALNAVALNISALGFIFYENSARYISPEKVEEIMLDIPPFINKVGVFVNSEYDEIVDIAKRCKLSTIQLHGNETPDFCMKFSRSVIKAISVREQEDIKKNSNV